MKQDPRPASSVVNSHNEWDPLEEIIVGIVEGASLPGEEPAIEAVMDKATAAGRPLYRNGGVARSEADKAPARKELDEFVHILEAEGVVVRRPEPIELARPFTTLDWTCPGGKAQTCPRDSLIVFGDEIIEATMSWRSLYFETTADKTILM